jgi:hypothetical protein
LELINEQLGTSGRADLADSGGDYDNVGSEQASGAKAALKGERFVPVIQAAGQQRDFVLKGTYYPNTHIRSHLEGAGLAEFKD